MSFYMHRKQTKKLSPLHLGAILREEFLVPLDLSPSALAKAMGVPRTRVERISAETTGVTADTELRLGKALGTSAALAQSAKSLRHGNGRTCHWKAVGADFSGKGCMTVVSAQQAWPDRHVSRKFSTAHLTIFPRYVFLTRSRSLRGVF
jgi:addiction module HigA family antidote